MADTPTSEPKTEAASEDRGREGAERGRRRGGRGKGKGQGERPQGERPQGERPQGERGPRADGERPQGERAAAGERGDDRGRGRGKGGGGKGRARDDNRRDRDRNDGPLKAGLFAGVADRQMPCRVAGCSNTWTWFGTQQIRSLGKPEPKRMCDEHLAEFEGIGDKQMPCRNSWCTNTWLWTRAAQLWQRERQDKLKPPHRLCEECFEEDKTTDDLQIACKIPECKNTWMWPRQAQLRHRAWVRRQQAKFDAEEADDAAHSAAPELVRTRAPASSSENQEAPEAEAPEAESSESEAPESEAHEAEASEADASESDASESDASEADAPAADSTATEATEAHEADSHEQADGDRPDKRRRRKRRRKRKVHDGPPEKLCESCFERLNHLEPIEIPCKVHGCPSTWTWEREGQLRAWASLDGRENVTELPQPPRRMCNGCFDFVRVHSDREVECGRPDCHKTWTYKTGAQLQDFLAGRRQDPIRLCEDCSRSQFVISSSPGMRMPAGAEVMPCMVSGCTGSWVYAPGMKLSAADPDAEEPPVDRMCDDCRSQRGESGRDPRRMNASNNDDADPAGAGEDVAEAQDPNTEPDEGDAGG